VRLPRFGLRMLVSFYEVSAGAQPGVFASFERWHSSRLRHIRSRRALSALNSTWLLASTMRDLRACRATYRCGLNHFDDSYLSCPMSSQLDTAPKKIFA
jgi:hypothetical protein